MIAFNENFPSVAHGETLILGFKNERNLFDGEYVFYEWYCSNPTCDCKEGIAEVIHIDPATKNEKTITSIKFSWANSKQGKWRCSIETGWQKTKAAKKLLASFEKIIEDPEYAEPFKRHYGIVKTKFKPHPITLSEPQQYRSKKIGRNDLCPCGSGKKYKKCCLLKPH